MDFNYNHFYNFYRTLGTHVDDVLIREYTADYVAMKYHRGEAIPFKVRSAIVAQLHADDPLVTRHHARFRHGAFVAYLYTI